METASFQPWSRQLDCDTRRRFNPFVFLGWLPVFCICAGSTAAPVDSARFLTQATFGPNLDGIQRLETRQINGWLTDQFATSPSLLLPKAQARYDEFRNECLVSGKATCPPARSTIKDTADDQWRLVWWEHAVRGPDQLRQRIAFALSEIFVVSDINSSLRQSAFGLASYYDMLSRNAFGNFRTLLEDVTLHPVMGIYLSMVNNGRGDVALDRRPDENFARELLELFTVGLYELNQDGTPKLDSYGKAIPTYTQRNVEGIARGLTGWTFSGTPWGRYFKLADRTVPMVPVERFHDTVEKLVLRGRILPARQSAQTDLKLVLDSIFIHPNIGPFIGKQLIQRLVTSNPSPGYVSRVAAAFDNNGQGVRGDMKAVIKAILLDPEARAGTAAHFGKPREPLLRLTHLFRAFGGTPIVGKEVDVATAQPVFRSPASGAPLSFIEREIGQNVLRSPTVFNFFRPNYAPIGALRSAGLVAPEFEILSDYAATAFANRINNHIQASASNASWSFLKLDREVALASNPDVLLDHLNLVLMAGNLTPELRAVVKKHLIQSPFPDFEAGKLARARDAIMLLANSPEYLIQK